MIVYDDVDKKHRFIVYDDVVLMMMMIVYDDVVLMMIVYDDVDKKHRFLNSKKKMLFLPFRRYAWLKEIVFTWLALKRLVSKIIEWHCRVGGRAQTNYVAACGARGR